MRLVKICLVAITLMLAIGCAAQAQTKQYVVDSKQAFNKIANTLVAGDTVVLKNGIWQDFEILFKGQGTKDKPITLKAETKGKVLLTGQSNLRLAGEHLVVSGLVFKDGYTPSSSVIEFRQNKDQLAYHSRVTEVVIDNFNNPDKRESDYWVGLYGQHNRFDHNHLVGKRNKGVTVAVRLNNKQSQQNYHKIDHNYFGYRPIFGSNGGETLRIGTSHFSLTDSHTLVENNYFEQTNGEVEIISVKSGKNIIRGNVFYEARGTLTMRHGNGNIIEENVFFGNNVDHTGGIRVINKQQIIRNNYLEGLTGYRFGSGFTVMNGVPNSPINRYHQVEDASIYDNTFVNVRHIQLAAGSDAERSAAPINSEMKNNLIINQDNTQPFTLFDDVSGIQFIDNVANTEVPKELTNSVDATAFNISNIKLERASNGLLEPVSDSVTAGAKRGLTVLQKEQTGVDWYPKVPAVIAFESGNVINVDAGANNLLSAINSADSGDVLVLAPGEYNVAKLIQIDKTLTIKAAKALTANVTFERSALFEIVNGGSLALDGLAIDGEVSPDYSGNSVVRTQKWGMVDNYRFSMINSSVTNLDVNHSFHFFTTGKVAFADEITLENNTFKNVTGDVLQLDAEIEDLGIYNAEYITVKNNIFTAVKGNIVTLYRGGSDESTFGPHLDMTNNKVDNAGLGKRNKSKSSLYIHGAQVVSIDNNRFNTSAPITIEHTVGEPKTQIINNVFSKTPKPSVTELRVQGPHTAIIKNNKVN